MVSPEVFVRTSAEDVIKKDLPAVPLLASFWAASEPLPVTAQGRNVFSTRQALAPPLDLVTTLQRFVI